MNVMRGIFVDNDCDCVLGTEHDVRREGKFLPKTDPAVLFLNVD
jgi:hypothetical protein